MLYVRENAAVIPFVLKAVDFPLESAGSFMHNRFTRHGDLSSPENNGASSLTHGAIKEVAGVILNFLGDALAYEYWHRVCCITR